MPDPLFQVAFPPAGTAELSACGKYRYTLTRHWDVQPGPMATFIMLNPSTADAAADDPGVKAIGDMRTTAMNGSFLRASLFTSVISFGVAALVMGLGFLFALLGLALTWVAPKPVVVTAPVQAANLVGATA